MLRKKTGKRRGKTRENAYARKVRVGAAAVALLGIGALALLLMGRPALLYLSVPGLIAAEKTQPIQQTSAPVKVQRVQIDADVSDPIKIELLSSTRQPSLDLSGEGPQVLIYHTHTTEAYAQSGKDTYEESGRWRTHDNERNVVRVGEELARILREEYGLNVLHDTTDHEPPKLATAYSRSEKTMRAYKEKYPSLTLFIDLHRDAHATDGTPTNDYVVIDGKETARLMFVVGTGEGATGTGFDEMPDFESNYALALAITNRLAEIDERFMRDVRVKTGRYNQHISSQCLLVEVGHNANTLAQALAAVPHLAEAIAYCAGSPPAQENGGKATGVPALWTPK